MKLPNFLNSSADSSPKIGHDVNNKGVQKLKLSKKKGFNKNVILNQYTSFEKKSEGFE